MCSFKEKELCDQAQLAVLNQWIPKTPEDRKAKLDADLAAIKKVEDEVKTLIQDLQRQYEEATKRAQQVAAQLSPNIRLIKSIDQDKRDEEAAAAEAVAQAAAKGGDASSGPKGDL